MRALVRQAMEEGALGVGSSLIYAPAFYAKTDELIALCAGGAAVRRHVHLAHAQRGQPAARSGRRADHASRARPSIPAEIYHLKAAGKPNWPKIDAGHRAGRGGARAGPAHHRRHVHLHRRRDRPRRGDAALGAGGRPARRGSSGCRTRRSARACERRCGRRPTPGRTCYLAAGSPERVLLVGFKKRRAQAADRQDAGRGGAACAARRRKRPRWTW